MTDILQKLRDERTELEMYRATFGPLPPTSATSTITRDTSEMTEHSLQSMGDLDLQTESGFGEDGLGEGFPGLPNLPSPGPTLLGEGLGLLDGLGGERMF